MAVLLSDVVSYLLLAPERNWLKPVVWLHGRHTDEMELPWWRIIKLGTLFFTFTVKDKWLPKALTAWHLKRVTWANGSFQSSPVHKYAAQRLNLSLTVVGVHAQEQVSCSLTNVFQAFPTTQRCWRSPFGTGEIVQSIKCLLHKREDLSSIPGTDVKARRGDTYLQSCC